MQNAHHSEIHSLGGPRFRPNLTIAEWEKGVPNALVAIDRLGEPLHFAINPTTIAELPEMTVQEASDLVYKVINRYYKVNTRRGCTERDSHNFNFQANVDDGSCKPTQADFRFGGVFQTCQNDQSDYDLCTGGSRPAAQKNPLTGDYICRDGYTAVELHTGSVSQTLHPRQCHKVHHFWCLGLCHSTKCFTTTKVVSAKYQAFWCVALGEVEQHSGYLFGGFYTSTASNLITGSMSCPRYFIHLHFGEDIYVCVSDDYDLGYENSVPFGGFESCQTGNPLASTNNGSKMMWPHDCSHGYSQLLVTVDEGCEINACIDSGTLNQLSLLPPKLPPFRKHPPYKKNATEALIISGVNGDVWLKQSDGTWKRFGDGELENGQQLLDLLRSNIPDASIDDPDSNQGSHGNEGSLSSGAVAAISVVSTLVLGVLVVVVVFAGRSIIRRRKPKNNGTDVYTPIETQINSGESTI